MGYSVVAFDADASPADAAALARWCVEDEPTCEPRPPLRAWVLGVRAVLKCDDLVVGRMRAAARIPLDAVDEARELAGAHGVGFYDPQTSELWLPRGEGELELVPPAESASRGPDPAPIARALLARLGSADLWEASGDAAAEQDFERRVIGVLDNARHRSPTGDLYALFLSHPAVDDIFFSRGELRAQLEAVVEQVLGRPPSSTTGWV